MEDTNDRRDSHRLSMAYMPDKPDYDQMMFGEWYPLTSFPASGPILSISFHARDIPQYQQCRRSSAFFPFGTRCQVQTRDLPISETDSLINQIIRIFSPRTFLVHHQLQSLSNLAIKALPSISINNIARIRTPACSRAFVSVQTTLSSIKEIVNRSPDLQVPHK